MKFVLSAIVSVACLFVSPSILSEIISVGSGQSIQEAIDLASVGDVVEINSNGPFEEIIQIRKSLTLRGGSGFRPVIKRSEEHSDPTIIQPSLINTGGRTDDVSDVIRLENLVVDNGGFFGQSAVRAAIGAIRSPQVLTLENMEIDGEVRTSGNNIDSEDRAVNLTVRNSTFENGSLVFGGGQLTVEDSTLDRAVFLINTRVADITVKDTEFQSAVTFFVADISEDVKASFERVSSSSSGTFADGDFVVSDSSFRSISIQGESFPTSLEVTDSEIGDIGLLVSARTSENAPVTANVIRTSVKGEVFVAGSVALAELNIESSIIDGGPTTRGLSSAGIRDGLVNSAAVQTNTKVTATNVTITRQRTAIRSHSSVSTYTNMLLFDNDVSLDISGANPTIRNSLIDQDIDGITGTNGNVFGDPDVSVNFGLLAGSAGIDIGDNTVVNSATDLNGSTRIQDSDNNGVAVVNAGAIEDTVLIDLDEDGIADSIDNCEGILNSDQADIDGDDLGDLCDPDIDGDGVLNADDAFPVDRAESVDTDGDGTGNNSDFDDDNDGQPDTDEIACQSNSLDATSLSTDADGDGIPDCVDTVVAVDTDGDGVLDTQDNCPTVFNPIEIIAGDLDGQLDSDRDGLGDVCDLDIDGDGVRNADDVFPVDSAESQDDDNDGTGNNVDNCPAVANPGQEDADDNGIGDACEAPLDFDGDGSAGDSIYENTGNIDGSAPVSVNSWGSGFNATFEYEIRDSDTAGGTLREWQVEIITGGSLQISNAWINSGYNAGIQTGYYSDLFVISNEGQGFIPELRTGDLLRFTVQGQGAGFGDNALFLNFESLSQTLPATGVCIDPVPVRLPFSFDGQGEFCWEVSGSVSSINSWGTESVTISGEEFGNRWSNSLPPTIDGRHTIIYNGSFPWSHFEISGKNAGSYSR